MILAAVILAAPQAPPTLAELERLPPASAGELALADREHGPIESFIRREGRGMDPPGLVRLELVEQAVALEGGCFRQRWTIDFIIGPDGIGRSHSAARSQTEVALLQSATCPQDGYVGLDSRIEPRGGLDALRHLDEIRAPRSRVHFRCSDSTSSHLCAGIRSIRMELARLSPWAIVREGDATIMWLGTPGGLVTELRYRAASPDRLTIKRELPPPF